MDWIRENFVFLLFVILFVVAHFIGYGMQEGRNDEEGKEKQPGEARASEKREQPEETQTRR